LLVEPWREADRAFAVSLRWDVRPTALLRDHRAQPVGVVSAVGEHHLSFADAVQQFGCCQDVVRLPRRDRELDRQSVAVGQSMDFRSKTAPASSKTSIRVAFFKVAAEWWTRTLVPSIIRTLPR
jgi:hypothetical protein